MKGGTVAVLLLGLGILTAPVASDAQQPKRVYRIGYLQTAPRESTLHMLKALEEGLRERGYTPGRDIIIEYRFAEESRNGFRIWPPSWSASRWTSF